MPDSAVVFVHGLFSSKETWGEFDRLMDSDPALVGFDRVYFEYSSPKVRWNPLRRIPNYNDLADSLRTFLEIDVGSYSSIVLVSHSQGGLIIQRYLARMLANGHGRDLARIRRIIFFACPNSGSEAFLLFRRGLIFWRHHQERELRPLNEAVTEAQQAVVNRIAKATRIASDRCPIYVVAYAGDSDNVVTPTSAKGVFENIGVIPGDHFTIIRPDSLKHRSYTTLKYNLLAALVQVDGKTVMHASRASSSPSTPLPDANIGEGDARIIARARPGAVKFILSPDVTYSFVIDPGGQNTDE